MLVYDVQEGQLKERFVLKFTLNVYLAKKFTLNISFKKQLLCVRMAQTKYAIFYMLCLTRIRIGIS